MTTGSSSRGSGPGSMCTRDGRHMCLTPQMPGGPVWMRSVLSERRTVSLPMASPKTAKTIGEMLLPRPQL
eukprot:10518601-Lingulodinium_polyedra.AAC.1